MSVGEAGVRTVAHAFKRGNPAHEIFLSPF